MAGWWMAAQQAAQRLPLEALPSISLKDLAARWGYSVAALGEYVKTGLLTCHVLLHDEVVETAPSFYGGQTETRRLNGHFRVPIRSAVAWLEHRPSGFALATPFEIVETEPDTLCGISEPSALRVLRQEADRFEAEVLSGSADARPGEPAFRNARTQRDALARARCEAVATLLWEENPARGYDDILDHPSFNKAVIAGDQRGWTRDTLKRWLEPVAPPAAKKPGRRSKGSLRSE